MNSWKGSKGRPYLGRLEFVIISLMLGGDRALTPTALKQLGKLGANQYLDGRLRCHSLFSFVKYSSKAVMVNLSGSVYQKLGKFLI